MQRVFVVIFLVFGSLPCSPIPFAPFGFVRVIFRAHYGSIKVGIEARVRIIVRFRVKVLLSVEFSVCFWPKCLDSERQETKKKYSPLTWWL